MRGVPLIASTHPAPRMARVNFRRTGTCEQRNIDAKMGILIILETMY
jgi:hypothetical protein